jgi:hypothetical protein
LLTQDGTEDFRKHPRLEGILRKTGDIDLYIDDVEKTNLIPVLNRVTEYFHATQQPNSLQIGKTVINYITEPQGLYGFTNEIENMLHDIRWAKLRAGNQTYSIAIAPPEYFIAAKLTGNKIKYKDQYDITILSQIAKETGQPIQEEQLYAILLRLGKPGSIATYREISSSL